MERLDVVLSRITKEGTESLNPLNRMGRSTSDGTIRDPVSLALAARARGFFDRTEAGLIRALCAVAYSVRCGRRPAALFWSIASRPLEPITFSAQDEYVASSWRKQVRSA